MSDLFLTSKKTKKIIQIDIFLQSLNPGIIFYIVSILVKTI